MSISLWQRVLDGIEAAIDAGLTPLKVNMVVKRGLNEHSLLPMAEHFRGTGVVLRFIEYMDVGSTNGWRLDQVVPAAEIMQRIDAGPPAGAARARTTPARSLTAIATATEGARSD